MTGERDRHEVSDGELVALLDGELSVDDQSRVLDALEDDARLRQRLELLRSADLPFKQAFEPLLQQAPRERLERMVGVAIKQAEMPRPRMLRGRWRMAAIAAGVVVALGVVFQAGRIIEQPASPSPDWHQAVADYQILYSRETLAGPALPPGAQADGLERVGKVLGVDLDHARNAVPGLDFKRAQLLEFGDQPLAQLAYLHDDRTPLAFCIRRTDEAPGPPESERLHGLNARHWVRHGLGFIVIGDLPDIELRAIADILEAGFS